MAVKALQVEHRVDAHAVCVGARACAHDDHRASDVLAREGLDLLLGHVLQLESVLAERRVVDAVGALAEHHEVRVAVGQALVVDHLGTPQPHLRRELLGGPARREPVGHRQREAQLHDPVAEMVGVGLDPGEVGRPSGVVRQGWTPPA